MPSSSRSCLAHRWGDDSRIRNTKILLPSTIMQIKKPLKSELPLFTESGGPTIRVASSNPSPYNHFQIPINLFGDSFPLSARVDPIIHEWKPPPENFFKLNMDAAIYEDDRCGFGAVIRDNDGYVLAAAMWNAPGSDDASLAEAMVVRLGLQLAAELLFLNLVVETDAIRIVRNLQNGPASTSYLGLILSDCLGLKAHFHNIVFTHVGRKGNQVAHVLAKNALTHPSQIWVEEVPPMAIHCIIANFCPII